LLLIVVGYLIAGVCYACLTPPWQAPDEPAHYNYIRYLVEEGHLPVLQMGDYPHDYLEEIKTQRFPPEMPIDPLRYEFHQPPVYYLLASVVYRLTSGSLLALRLLSVALGSGLLVVTWALARAVFPQQPALALGSTAFVAFLPMHVAMSSAVNNDALAELLLAAALLGLVHYLGANDTSPRRPAELGLLIGLGLVTKIWALIALPLALVAVIIAPRDARSLSPGHLRARDGSLILGLAALVVLPWLARNHLTYGGLDLWGLVRHDQIVVGQPRTAEWLAQMGWRGLLQAFGRSTFQSFWGQFGWMGVPLDSRLYFLLKLLSGLVALGAVLFVERKLRVMVRRVGPRDHLLLRPGPLPWRLLGLLTLWLVLTVLCYLWYNLQFVQHQGRYLFPALVPLGLVFAVGLAEVLARRRTQLPVGLCLSGLLLLMVKGLLVGELDRWATALVAGTAMALLLRRLLPGKWDAWVDSLPYVGLFALDFICLFGFIVPGLS